MFLSPNIVVHCLVFSGRHQNRREKEKPNYNSTVTTRLNINLFRQIRTSTKTTTKVAAQKFHKNEMKKNKTNEIQRIKNDTTLDGMITTNSIPLREPNDKIKVVDISSLLAEAIRRTNSNESISELFEIKGF